MSVRDVQKLINRRNVAKHGIHAFNNDKRITALNLALAAQALIQIFGAIMTKANGRRIGQPRTVNDAGMRISVHKDNILIPR